CVCSVRYGDDGVRPRAYGTPVDRVRSPLCPARNGAGLRLTSRHRDSRCGRSHVGRRLRPHGPPRPATRGRAGAQMSFAHASSAALEPMGALAGLLFAVGGLLIAWRLRALQPRLVARVEPYLREPPGRSGLLNIYSPFPQLERVLQPVLA